MTSAAPLRVHFPAQTPFQRELKRRVDRWFEERSLSPRGGARLALKAAILFAWFAASYCALVFLPVPAWATPLLAISVGLAIAGIGFSVTHDANHGSFFESGRWNRALSFAFDLIGASSLLWRHKHNVLHHTYTNVSQLDTDLEVGPLLRLAPWQQLRPLHRYQHLYAPLLFGLFPLRWMLYDDFRELATRKIGTHDLPPPRRSELVITFLFKGLFITWLLVIPLLLHPVANVVLLVLLGSFVAGNVIAWTFQLAHCVERAEYVEASAEQQLARGFAEHQFATTVNFAQENRLLSWYVGGLNFQVEHHLFPRISHIHYPGLSKVLESTCREYGVDYRTVPSVGGALLGCVRWMRDLGRGHGAPSTEQARPAGQGASPVALTA